jgi:hypothetical protein
MHILSPGIAIRNILDRLEVSDIIFPTISGQPERRDTHSDAYNSHTPNP